MRPQTFSQNTVWCIHSPRSGEYWFVRCPSRSGAKIFLCGPLGPKVDVRKGPFEAWECFPEDIPSNIEILQATFFRANDPRNWQENCPDPPADTETTDEPDASGTERTEPPAAESG